MKIGTYKGLEVGKVEYTPVTAEEVQTEIDNLLKSKISTKAKEGKSVLGDTVNIDYEGFLDGVPFDGGKAEKYDLELGSHSFIPGFEEGLVGYEKGADVDVNVTFPEQYQAENLAGKAVVFKCHIHEVKEKVEAVLDDALAQSFGIPTAEELKKELERQMNAKKKNEADNEYLDKLVKNITDNSEIEVSEEMVKSRIDEMVDYYEQQMAQYGMNLDSYLQMSGKTMEQFRDEIANDAIESAKGDILFNEIAKAENLTVTDEEADHEMDLYKNYYRMDDATFEKFVSEKKQDVINDILRRKTATLLIENNK